MMEMASSFMYQHDSMPFIFQSINGHIYSSKARTWIHRWGICPRRCHNLSNIPYAHDTHSASLRDPRIVPQSFMSTLWEHSFSDIPPALERTAPNIQPVRARRFAAVSLRKLLFWYLLPAVVLPSPRGVKSCITTISIHWLFTCRLQNLPYIAGNRNYSIPWDG